MRRSHDDYCASMVCCICNTHGDHAGHQANGQCIKPQGKTCWLLDWEYLKRTGSLCTYYSTIHGAAPRNNSCCCRMGIRKTVRHSSATTRLLLKQGWAARAPPSREPQPVCVLGQQQCINPNNPYLGLGRKRVIIVVVACTVRESDGDATPSHQSHPNMARKLPAMRMQEPAITVLELWDDDEGCHIMESTTFIPRGRVVTSVGQRSVERRVFGVAHDLYRWMHTSNTHCLYDTPGSTGWQRWPRVQSRMPGWR